MVNFDIIGYYYKPKLAKMERLRGNFIVVADDGGLHPAIERGIKLAAEHGGLFCADYMIERENALPAILSLRQEYPNINIGLHVEIGQLNDYTMTAIAYFCRWQPSARFQQTVLQATEYQIKSFQDKLGDHPVHLSTHGNIHMDHSDRPFPWFADRIRKLYEGGISNILVRGIDTIPIRHTRAREMMRGKNPLTPSQFEQVLLQISPVPDKPLELIVHPASKGELSDPSFRAMYTLAARERDLDALIAIIRAGVIEEAGYKLVAGSENSNK